MKKIAIITVNYNTEKDTIKLLNSLEKIEKKNFTIQTFVVDNGSKKIFHLNRNNFKNNISILYLNKNTGFAGGYNSGIRLALKKRFDYVLIINNDTKVYSDMLKQLVNVLERDAKIGVTVPKIYFAAGHEFHKKRYKPNELGKVIWYAGGFTDWKNIKSIHRGVDEVDRGQFAGSEPIEFATGCCILFKREVLEKVGLFDERYFLYYEDADLSERIKKAGYMIYYVPQACLIHANAASSGGPGNKLHDYFLTRNQMLFGMTYAPLRSKIALIRQSLRIFLSGRPYQKKAIKDYFLKKFGQGTFFD